MVQLFYVKCDEDISNTRFYNYLNELPSKFHTNILKYKNRGDALLTLFGKLLLGTAIKANNLDLSLDDISYSLFGRPFFFGSDIDFNISHSSEYVVCALSLTQKIGVDIEKILSINFADFDTSFSTEEWSGINSSGNPLRTFYHYWTAKEAVIKADGRGLSIEPKNVLIFKDLATISNQRWYLMSIDVDKDYVLHLASPNNLFGEISIQEVCFDFS